MIKSLSKRLLAAMLYQAAVPSRKLAKSDGWRVLMYHRIVRPDNWPYPLQAGMYVRPETFLLQMEWLKKHCSVLPLAELAEEVKNGKNSLAHTVAITFDDGWADTYSEAFPVLNSLGLPATVFLATSYIDTKEIFWTDVVAVAIAAISAGYPLAEAKSLSLVRSGSYDEMLLELFYAMVQDKRAVSEQNILEYLIQTFKAYERRQREGIVEVLKRSFAKQILALTRQFLTWLEIKEMSQCRLDFAVHSHGHENLVQLEKIELEQDVAQAELSFAKNNIKRTPLFCYPGGYYSEVTQQVLNTKQYVAALKVGRESILQGTPPLLGRIGMHDDVSRSAALFACRLSLKYF